MTLASKQHDEKSHQSGVRTAVFPKAKASQVASPVARAKASIRGRMKIQMSLNVAIRLVLSQAIPCDRHDRPLTLDGVEPK